MRSASEYFVVEQTQQVLPIRVFLQRLGQLLQFGCVDVAFSIGDFFRTSHFQALAILDGGDELTCFQQRLVGAGIKPCYASIVDPESETMV